MARLLGIRIRNYKSLADLGLGQVEYATGDALPRFACFIGPNGSGKSTLLDAFGFVADCLLEGVEAACDKPHRGGFDRLRTQGSTEPISFELFFDSEDKSSPIVYTIDIALVDGVPAVIREWLRQRRKGETKGKPYHFLKLERGEGKVWKGAYVEGAKDDAHSERIKLDDLNRLGLATLGNLASHPRIVRLRNYIEQWYLSYFIPNAARVLPPAGAQPRLDSHGANVANVLQYLKRTYSKQFDTIKDKLTKSIPGLKGIEPEESKDRRLLLKFDEDGYTDPFYQQSMSDGTLKMLAYAVLLHDPMPRPFLGIEEPENGLYVELIESLARQFVGHTAGRNVKTQIFVTTHSPYFVDALKPDQVWIMRKSRGQTTARRVADLGVVSELKERGIPLGAQWYANYFTDTSRQGRAKP